METCAAITLKGTKCKRKIVTNGRCKQHSEEASTATITITFGEVAENHVGNQQIGEMSDKGFSIKNLKKAKKILKKKGIECELIDLVKKSGESKEDYEPAFVLIARNFLRLFKDTFTPDEMENELISLDWDKKAFMRGRVVNKRARFNLCFDDESQEPEYEMKNGRVISFADVLSLKTIREELPSIIGEKARNLKAEGNLYYDIKKCGIGFHGDSERKKVIAVRIGASLELHYQWFHRFKPIGKRIKLNLNSGDMYIMSEKATGFDWKSSSKYTLRHATGCKKYLTI